MNKLNKLNFIFVLLISSNLFAEKKLSNSELADFYQFNRAVVSCGIQNLKNNNNLKHNQFIHAILDRNVEDVKKLVCSINLKSNDGQFPDNDQIQMDVDFNKLDENFLKKIEFNKQKLPSAVLGGSVLSIAIINYCLATNQQEKDASYNIVEVLLNNHSNPNQKLARAYFDQEGRDYISYYLLFVELLEINCPNEIFKLLMQHNLNIDFKISDFATNERSLREAASIFSREDILTLNLK